MREQALGGRRERRERRFSLNAVGQKDLLQALGSYERAMREYGYQAVAASAQAEAATVARRHSFMLWLVNYVPRGRLR